MHRIACDIIYDKIQKNQIFPNGLKTYINFNHYFGVKCFFFLYQLRGKLNILFTLIIIIADGHNNHTPVGDDEWIYIVYSLYKKVKLILQENIIRRFMIE